ncbi:hypothetical protein D3C81_08170 [compost metagenome]
MSITVSKVLGYCIDIQDFIDSYANSVSIDTIVQEKKEFLRDLGFNTTNYISKVKAEDIIILEDGLSGEYSKLIYVLSVVEDSEDDVYKNEQITKVINKHLSDIRCPKDIRHKLDSVMKILFNYTGENKIILELVYNEH